MKERLCTCVYICKARSMSHVLRRSKVWFGQMWTETHGVWEHDASEDMVRLKPFCSSTYQLLHGSWSTCSEISSHFTFPKPKHHCTPRSPPAQGRTSATPANHCEAAFLCQALVLPCFSLKLCFQHCIKNPCVLPKLMHDLTIAMIPELCDMPGSSINLKRRPQPVCYKREFRL